MDRIKILETRFILDEKELLFLPLIYIEDMDVPGTRHWTLFNSCLFKEKWSVRFPTYSFIEINEIMNLIEEYDDTYYIEAGTPGFVGIIHDSAGKEMTPDELKSWAIINLHKNIKLSDLDYPGMGIYFKHPGNDIPVRLDKHTDTIEIDGKKTWIVETNHLWDCPGFSRRLFHHAYIISIEKQLFYHRMSTKEEIESHKPRMKVTNNNIFCRKFKTEDEALELCMVYHELFANSGYEITTSPMACYL